MNDLSVQLMEIARTAVASSDDARSLAAESVTRLGADQLHELAVREVIGWIEHLRRAEALNAERDATTRRSERGARTTERHANIEERKAERRSHFEEWFDDPSILDGGRTRSDSGKPTIWMNKVDRTPFMKWLGDRYDDWYQRGCESVDSAERAGAYSSHEERTLFKADYYDEGAAAWYALERARYTTDLVNRVSEEVRLETTEKLLSTVFALGDGARTTWGRATVLEHEQRISLLSKNATGVIETAARHRAAIAMILAAGATCLAELSDSTEMQVAA